MREPKSFETARGDIERILGHPVPKHCDDVIQSVARGELEARDAAFDLGESRTKPKPRRKPDADTDDD